MLYSHLIGISLQQNAHSPKQYNNNKQRTAHNSHLQYTPKKNKKTKQKTEHPTPKRKNLDLFSRPPIPVSHYKFTSTIAN